MPNTTKHNTTDKDNTSSKKTAATTSTSHTTHHGAAKTTHTAKKGKDDSNLFNKNGLINLIKEQNGITEVQAGTALQWVVTALTTVLSRPGGEIKLVGLFSMKSSITPPRVAINPKTREQITVPHRVKTSFAMSKALKKRVLEQNGITVE